jgi:hypothetical protein
MGKKSRLKHGRISTPLPRFRWAGYGLSRSTLIFVAGVVIFCYGTSAILYSRWDHAYNRTVQPVFHPWAILVGLIMIILALRMRDTY